jgi:hypothetical protein
MNAEYEYKRFYLETPDEEVNAYLKTKSLEGFMVHTFRVENRHIYIVMERKTAFVPTVFSTPQYPSYPYQPNLEPVIYPGLPNPFVPAPFIQPATYTHPESFKTMVPTGPTGELRLKTEESK